MLLIKYFVIVDCHEDWVGRRAVLDVSRKPFVDVCVHIHLLRGRD